MNEMETHDAGMDALLRRSMAAPVPSLPPDFDQRLMREARRGSEPHPGYPRLLITGYGLTSVVVSTVVMRGQGLGWGMISAMTLGPLALVLAASRAWRTTHATARHHSA